MFKIKNNLQSKNLQPKTYNLQPSRGFTLIELLVVIAIIGILSSVVLASLNSARNKGSDAAVKANMQAVRAQAEIYYDNNSQSYGASAVCTYGSETFVFSDTTIKNMLAQMKNNNGGTQPTCNTNSTGQDWAVSSPLKSGSTYCMDNSGTSILGKVATGGVCA